MQLVDFSHAIKTATAFPLINAVLAGLQNGKIFIDGKTDSVLFFIHKAGFSFLTADSYADYNQVLNFLLASKEIPVYFHVYDPPVQFLAICKSRSGEINIKERKRIQLKYIDNSLKYNNFRLSENYAVKRIDNSNFEKLLVFNLSLENKFWNSKSDFEKNGFGFCVFNAEDIPVSICYTACVVNNTAEIDVATLIGYQQMGFAKHVVHAFVEFCLQNNIIANWDCFEDNHASLKTAEHIGFSFTKSYNFLSIFNKTKV